MKKAAGVVGVRKGGLFLDGKEVWKFYHNEKASFSKLVYRVLSMVISLNR